MIDPGKRISRRRFVTKAAGGLAAAALAGRLSGAQGNPSDGPTALRVGLAPVCITPKEPVWLYGYAGKSRFRPFEGVLEDIHAKAMANVSHNS